MRSVRCVLVAAATLVASCALHAPVVGPTGPSEPKRSTAAPKKPSPIPTSRSSLPPPKPLAGEPSSEQLAEARLVSAECSDGDENAIQAEIEKMRAAVREQMKRWHDAQPACWQAYRERARYDGLGLAGIGSGGGAIGYGSVGIGLGSIGTIGHGAGRGAPKVRMGASHRTASGASKPSDRGRVASGTNNQVAGVDEADIVKTDGRFIYIATGGALRIIDARDPKIVSVTTLGGSLRELFVEGDRAVVYASSKPQARPCRYAYDCQFAGDGSSTTVRVLALGDRLRPKVVRTLELSGSLIASRRIGKAIHTVVADGDSQQPRYPVWPPDLLTCGTHEATVRAKFAKLMRDNEQKIRLTGRKLPTLSVNGKHRSLCEGALRAANSNGTAYTTLVSFDLDRDDETPKTAMIQSRPVAVFASGDALYLSVVNQKNSAGRWYSFYSSVDEVSEIHKFAIGERAEITRYVGSGVVPGHVLNQFAMDQWQDHLRIATSRGRVPNPNVHSVVSVLREGEGGNLVRVGAVSEIAPGEDIRAVRFDGDRGYVVTFKKTDPLFVIDLAEPTRPSILGELKIPGFSTYIHRMDDKHLLSIGFDADDQGDFAYFDGVLLQIFDVSNPRKPKLVHKEKIGTRGSSSEAATNHLAFNYLAEHGLLAVPMTICKGGGVGRNGTKVSFSGLLVYDVSAERGFSRRGGIDHSSAGADCNTWWSNANSVVKRSVFLDELVYSIATDRVKVQRLSALGKDVADLSLLP